MADETAPFNPGYIVIGKTRTIIWRRITKSREHPIVIYDPDAKPQLKSVSGPRPTSNYSYQDHGKGSGGSYKLIPSWLSPRINQKYCDHIYQHLQDFDHVYLLGGGIGRWSGVNNFMEYIAQRHPESLPLFSLKRYLRFTDFSERRAKEILKKMGNNTL